MSDVIVVASGKGGVGKTVVSANLGIALSKLGKKVALVDLDIGLRNLDIVLGYDDKVIFDLLDVVGDSCSLEQALIRDKAFENLAFLPSAQTTSKGSLSDETFMMLCNKLKNEFDFVIVDCPAGIGSGFETAVSAADKVLIVTTPELCSIRDTERVAAVLEERGTKEFFSVINKIRPDLIRKGTMLTVDEILSLMNVDLLGVIPDDPDMFYFTNTGRPVVAQNNSFASTAFSNIAERLCGNHIPLMDMNEKRFSKEFQKIYKKRK